VGEAEAVGRGSLKLAPVVVRRASSSLLEDYLLDEREASPTVRRERQERLLVQTSRASTAVFEEFLGDAAAASPAVAPQPAPVRPHAAPAPVSRRPAVRPVLAPVAAGRAAHATRLVPLSPEIAIG
jgi:hypothetical protein